MTTFTIRIEDTPHGFSLEAIDSDSSIIQVLYLTTSWILISRLFSEAVERLHKNNHFNLKKFSQNRNNTFAEFEAFFEFTPEREYK